MHATQPASGAHTALVPQLVPGASDPVGVQTLAPVAQLVVPVKQPVVQLTPATQGPQPPSPSQTPEGQAAPGGRFTLAAHAPPGQLTAPARQTSVGVQVAPCWQDVPHTPAEQTWGEGQLTPRQRGSTQAPLRHSWPTAQVVAPQARG